MFLKAVSNSPVISSGGMWPGGIQFLIPASNFPPTTTCSPYDVTIESNITFKYGTLGKVGVDRLLLPISVTPMCLTRTGTSSGDQLKVSIEFSSPHLQAYKSFLPFMIDFGDKLLELDPLKLVKVVGSDRIDYVYDVDRGKVYLMVYPNSTTFGTDIIVSVPPAITSNSAGNVNTGASYFVHYVPNIEPLKVVSIVVMAAFAGTLASSWLTSLVVSSMHPSATAGSLGFGAIGFILWAQKLYLIGLTSSPALPANYRIVSDFFSWTSFLLGTPWTWGVSPVPGIPRNLTSSSSVFPMDALVVLDSETLNYVYYYPSSKCSWKAHHLASFFLFWCRLYVPCKDRVVFGFLSAFDIGLQVLVGNEPRLRLLHLHLRPLHQGVQ